MKRPRVALLIESSRGYGRRLLRGVARYARNHGPWSLVWQDRGLEPTVPDWLRGWQGDGIIARVESRDIERATNATGVPVVDVRGRFDLNTPLVETDDQLVAQAAAEHLIERGFTQFAYCGFAGVNYSERRLQFFPACLQERGFDCIAYEAAASTKKKDQRIREQHGIQFERELADWVKSLPRPIGVMACNDLRGQQLLNACREVDVAVPDDVAVIGVDNDRVICELSDPPLSSVEPDADRIGYEAAALLDRMMQGESPSQKKTFIAPSKIATRQSSDVLAIDDELVSQAVRYIRQHACEG
ncbi:MAG: XylR family transcriptional regulator, partial [Planctomycetales bacterium]